MSMQQVLIVDDERNMCELIHADLRIRDIGSQWFTSADEALLALSREEFDVVLTDLKMPGTDGIELCKRIAENRADVPVIVMTAFGSMETAVAAIRAGAYDFVTKPIEMDLLALTIERALRHHTLQEEVKTLSQEVAKTQRIDDILGSSVAMQELFDKMERIGDSDANVLITGESGTGKELVAKALHRQSDRSEKPFVAVNCSALPDNLLESELFGHTQGSFTDAREDRKGLFLQAEGGTLFLDEIGEMPMVMQPKLLRALEEGVLRPVGGDQEVTFDVRVLSATNRDLEVAVEEDRFREDLFYRIHVIQLELPSLRARGTDALLLAQHFVEHFGSRSKKEVNGLSEGVAEKLLAYNWPGNVRELRNVIERAVALTRYEKLVVEDLPKKIREYKSSQIFIDGKDPGELAPLEDVERRYILHVLESAGENRTLASRILGMDRKTLYRKLRQYGADDA